MRIFPIVSLLLCAASIPQISAFIRPPPPRLPPTPPPQPQQRLREFAKLARLPQNFVPVTILNILNGVVTNPASPVGDWILSPQFLAASAMVHLFTAGSMVLNDLYDIEVDKINNPARPLVSGTIRPQEAAAFAMGLFSLYGYLGVAWVPAVAGPIWKLSLATVLLYTPFLKRIPLVKNLACSSIVAATVPFMGLSIMPDATYSTILAGWSGLTTRAVFATSIFIEVVQDIMDREGDGKMGIRTLPVLVGPQNTLWALTVFLLANYMQSVLACVDLYHGALHPVMFGAVLSAYFPLFMNIYEIQRARFSKLVIRRGIKSTTGSMVAYFVAYLVWFWNGQS